MNQPTPPLNTEEHKHRLPYVPKELEDIANEMMHTLLERHDVLAKGWHEPVYGKKIHIGNTCQACGTHFVGLREDIKHLFKVYAQEYATQLSGLGMERNILRKLFVSGADCYELDGLDGRALQTYTNVLKRLTMLDHLIDGKEL